MEKKSNPKKSKSLISGYSPNPNDRILANIEADYKKVLAILNDQKKDYEKINSRTSKLAIEDLKQYRANIFNQKEKLCLSIKMSNNKEKVKAEFAKYNEIKKNINKFHNTLIRLMKSN